MLTNASMSPGQSQRGTPHPHCLLGVSGLLCVLPEVWLTAGSSPTEGDLPVCALLVLSLLLVVCVTEPVQLAKQAKPHLAAVVCCCGNWLCCCWYKEREGERNGSTSLVGVSSYPCSCVKVKSVEETLLYRTQNSCVLGFGQFLSLKWLCKISVLIISTDVCLKLSIFI